jgi:hypothetical protein
LVKARYQTRRAVAPYELLKQQLRQALADQSFQKDVPGRKVEVRVTDVDLHPSKDSLALGFKIDAKTPGSWFDTAGWVYLSGKPKIVAGGKAVLVNDISSRRSLTARFLVSHPTVISGRNPKSNQCARHL